eukprot:TRINITY_DN5423_c0_g1_i2.p1 TRINITY_DN5423_c0_g1~~TRINITY_DN5423_c0_g1_i2.p1  ORF type:complete len:131 (-),score=13.84 TRINITY_DN5423_c0_g1_i2:190-582(-)
MLKRLCINDNFMNGLFNFYPRRTEKQKAGYSDVYPHTTLEADKGWLLIYYHVCNFQKSWIFPLRKMRIGDDYYPSPKDPIQYLSYMYGDEWMKPRPEYQLVESKERPKRCLFSGLPERAQKIRETYKLTF